MFPTSCISYSWLIYFVTESLSLLIYLTYFLSFSPFPSGNHLFCSLYWWVFLFCYVCSFIFQIPYISEIIQYPFFSVRLRLFSVIHSRSMHVVTNGKISLFFMSEQYYIVSIYVSYLLYPFVYWWALWRRIWQPTPVFFPGEFHWQRSLVGYRPWDHRIRHDHVTNTWLFPYLGFCK